MTDIPNSMEIEAIEYKKAPEIGKALVTEIDLSRTSRIWMKYASFHSIYAAITYFGLHFQQHGAIKDFLKNNDFLYHFLKNKEQ